MMHSDSDSLERGHLLELHSFTNWLGVCANHQSLQFCIWTLPFWNAKIIIHTPFIMEQIHHKFRRENSMTPTTFFAKLVHGNKKFVLFAKTLCLTKIVTNNINMLDLCAIRISQKSTFCSVPQRISASKIKTNNSWQLIATSSYELFNWQHLNKTTNEKSYVKTILILSIQNLDGCGTFQTYCNGSINILPNRDTERLKILDLGWYNWKIGIEGAKFHFSY